LFGVPQFVLRTAASLVFLHDYWVLVPEAVAALEEREGAYDELLLMREELQERQAAAAAAAASRDKHMAALYTSAEALQVRGDQNESSHQSLLGEGRRGNRVSDAK
jgi:hypothetical protein